MRNAFPCVLAKNKRFFFLRFLVSGVVHFPAKDVIIVPYGYFATCILGHSLMYNIITENMRDTSFEYILYYCRILKLFLNNANLLLIEQSDFAFWFVFSCCFFFLFFVLLLWRKLNFFYYYRPFWNLKQEVCVFLITNSEI